MASLSEHAEKIKAAIEAARQDGYIIEPDVDVVFYNGHVERVDLDLWERAGDGRGAYVTLMDWDYT